MLEQHLRVSKTRKVDCSHNHFVSNIPKEIERNGEKADDGRTPILLRQQEIEHHTHKQRDAHLTHEKDRCEESAHDQKMTVAEVGTPKMFV